MHIFLSRLLSLVVFWVISLAGLARAELPVDSLAPVGQRLRDGRTVRVIKTYPQGRMRASCQGFDDGGLGSDWPVLEALNKRGIAGTFFINSTNPHCKDALNFPKRYQGHEIASHGANHKGLVGMTPEQVRSEITTDQQILGEKFGQPIIGFAYPYGAVYEQREKQDALEAQFRSFGLIYARGTRSSQAFAPPADFIYWNPDCGFMDPLERFLKAPAEDIVRVRMCFTHSIEFARGTSSFSKWERMLDQLVADPSIWNVTMRDYVLYVEALRALRIAPDALQNDADSSVWVKLDGQIHEIPARTSLPWGKVL